MSRWCVVVMLGLLVLLLSAASFAQGVSVTCASDNMGRNYCDVGQNGGVRLIRQRSDARCTEGSTWGTSGNQIWVDRGCRADFEVLPVRGGWNGNPNAGGAGTVTCASEDMRRNYCNVGANGGIRLLRQRSDARCTEGSTWGASNNQIWVDRGCRADFTVLPVGDGWNPNRPDRGDRGGDSRIVTCSSDDMQRNYCYAGRNGGIHLLRQKSDARCVEGRTFGVKGDQIWVDRGCRADFEVLARGGRGRDHDWDNDHDRDDRGRSGSIATIYCASDDMHRNYCNVGPNRGIRLVHQRSDARCEQGRTYGFDRDRIWVDRGCRADFEVQTRR